MIENPLLPCPFCGGTAYYVHTFTGPWTIFCDTCKTSSDLFKFKKDAEAAWNRRVTIKVVGE